MSFARVQELHLILYNDSSGSSDISNSCDSCDRNDNSDISVSRESSDGWKKVEKNVIHFFLAEN